MHGGRSPGARPGAAHPNYKTGKYTKQARELVRQFTEMAKTAEVLVSVAMRKAGLRPLKPLRRRRHVVRAIVELKKAAAKAKPDGEKP
jgi:hypothetical protein